MATESKVLYEFGPFRLDPDKQALLREDQPVPITPKAFETLLILVRHSREVVTKDELMKAVWPDAFVEEQNLSQNIFTIRRALGETPEDRRYIVTVPGRGYRFAAQVRTLREGGEDLVIESRSRSQMAIEQVEDDQPHTVPALSMPRHHKPIWKQTLTMIVVVLLALGAVFFLRRPPPIALGTTNSVLIADFVNTTGDPVFDGTLRQGLEIQLEQSPFPEPDLRTSVSSGRCVSWVSRQMRGSLRSSPGSLRANRQRGRPRRLDRKPWKPVRVGVTRQELPQRRHPRSGAGASSEKRRCPECPESNCQ